MPRYMACGLVLDSERVLPDGVPTAETLPVARCDVLIRWGAPADSDSCAHPPGTAGFDFRSAVHRLSWPSVGVVELTGPGEVLVRPLPDAVPGIVEHALLGPVLAHILLLRGELPLHASSNCVGQGLIATVAESGVGKSTLAAALNAAGAAAYGDDLLGVPAERFPRVAFGIGRVKLNPDVIRALEEDTSQLLPVYDTIEKRAKALAVDASSPRRPLAAVYWLSDGEQIEIEPVDPKVAAFQLLANCFRLEVARRACPIHELLRRCAAIASGVPTFTLKRPRDLSQLPAVAHAVTRHASALRGCREH